MPQALNQPQSGNAMPRFAGLATMMRLPAAEWSAATLWKSPRPMNPSGNTALLAANLLYQMLCVLPDVTYR
jgi:hypothetical protein